MTRDEWIAQAIAAADRQVGRVAVEDGEVLDTIAEAVTRTDAAVIASNTKRKNKT